MNRYPTIRNPDEWPSYVEPHTVTFVRHGDKNGPGFSADLTEKGRRDSVCVGSKIKHPVDLFLASPSPRARSTAECIREGNGSSAPIVIEEQLAEPGSGYYHEYRLAMKSFLKAIISHIEDNNADIVVATTHNYVIDYISELPGCRQGVSDLLCGITLNMETLYQIEESL
ncbi:MAG: histidine phosphatase family protein [archaeon]|nr:histidine phosphatase family protein [archaeon]